MCILANLMAATDSARNRMQRGGQRVMGQRAGGDHEKSGSAAAFVQSPGIIQVYPANASVFPSGPARLPTAWA